jgi:sugar transferase (PEP-CTERM system associated)
MRQKPDQLLALGQSIGSGCLLLGILYFIFPNLLIGRGVFFISVGLVTGIILLNRTVLDRVWQMAAPAETVLIIGTGKLAEVVAEELAQRVDLSFRLAGFLAATPERVNVADLPQGPVLGSGDDLLEVARTHLVSRIVVALEDRRGVLPTRDLVRLRVQGIRVEDATSTISSLTGRVWLETIRPSWFVFSDGFRRSTVTLILKRIIDLGCAVIGLVMSLPIMMLVALAIRLDSKGPILYRQTRVGLRGKCFKVLKFRSMRVDAEAGQGAQWAVDRDPRVTRIGRFLRKYRLDELPQFVNVIRGEMSFVGPRPERPEFVEILRKEISYYDERHSVRPGLTGWAQVRYPYGSNVKDAIRKMEYDLFYLKNMSLLFDCAIILDTVRIVIGGRGGK